MEVNVYQINLYKNGFLRHLKFDLNKIFDCLATDYAGECKHIHISFDEQNFCEVRDFEDKKFTDILIEICDENIDRLFYLNLKNYLLGRNSHFKLDISFDKAIFESYPNFDNLRCHKLSFSNTVFKKGARFRHINVDDVLFEPRELSADATFFHREKADIDAGKLRGDKMGRIGRFKYRHQLEGDGTTFLIGMNFTERAEFTDCVLDKIQFSFIDEGSMSKCFFANSMMEDAKFYNCDFPSLADTHSVLAKDSTNKPAGLALSAIFIFATYLMATADAFIFAVALIAAMYSIFITMPIFDLFGMFFRTVFKVNANTHKAIADDIEMIKKQKKEHQEDNYKTIREIYRQLKNNFDKHGDYQTAGDFYYSQRYCEAVNFGGTFRRQFAQTIILWIHYSINGFGERWLRAFIWFLVTLLGFAFLYMPNEDFISTKSTPEYFLNAYHKDGNKTSQVAFNREKITGKACDANDSHFMEIATTSYKDDDKKDINKTFYAYDSRFDFDYTSQLIPILKNEFEVKFAHSLSKMIAPFISEEKKWFQDRSSKAYYIGFLETILLWIFFLAFVFAVKNRIRR